MTSIVPLSFDHHLLPIHALGAAISIEPVKTYSPVLVYRVSFPNGFNLRISNAGCGWNVMVNDDLLTSRELSPFELLDFCEECSLRTDKPEEPEWKLKTFGEGGRLGKLTPISFEGMLKLHSFGARRILMDRIKYPELGYEIAFPNGRLRVEKMLEYGDDLWDVHGDGIWSTKLTEDELIALCEEFSKSEGGEEAAGA